MKSEGGFTILEVLVAVVILGLSYVTVLQCFSLSLKNIAKIEEQRTRLFEDVSYLMHAAHFSGEDSDEEPVGEEFLVGQRFRLVLLSSENGELSTLRIEQIDL